jgi:hypothetical protein
VPRRTGWPRRELAFQIGDGGFGRVVEVGGFSAADFCSVIVSDAEVSGRLMANTRLIFSSLATRGRSDIFQRAAHWIGAGSFLDTTGGQSAHKIPAHDMVKMTTGSMTRVPPAAILPHS